MGKGLWTGGRGRNLVTATHRSEATSGGESGVKVVIRWGGGGQNVPH